MKPDPSAIPAPPATTVQQLGEQGVLARLQRFCPSEIVGDDAAVLPLKADQQLVVTTDMLVEEVHFSLGRSSLERCTMTAADAGWRATAANLSDLAAMGATPLGLTVALGVPGDFSLEWLEFLYQGISDCLQAYGTVLVGGDLCRSPVVTLGITAFGQVNPAHTIRRDRARVGDAIAVTGLHGDSRAGLELLLNPQTGQGLNAAERDRLIRSHQRPLPRLDVLPLIDCLTQPESDEGTNYFPVSGIDSSDGLADAVVQICRASGVGATLYRDRIPLSSALSKLVSADRAMQWALYGGEDFELVLCLPPTLAQQLVDRLGEGAAIVGEIVADPAVQLVDNAGQYPTERLTLSQGFQHF